MFPVFLEIHEELSDGSKSSQHCRLFNISHLSPLSALFTISHLSFLKHLFFPIFYSIHYIISIFMIYFSLFILIIVANLYAASQLSQDANLTAMLTDVMLTAGHAQLPSWAWPPSTGVQTFRHSFINTCSLWFFSMDIFSLFSDHL